MISTCKCAMNNLFLTFIFQGVFLNVYAYHVMIIWRWWKNLLCRTPFNEKGNVMSAKFNFCWYYWYSASLQQKDKVKRTVPRNSSYIEIVRYGRKSFVVGKSMVKGLKVKDMNSNLKKPSMRVRIFKEQR